MYTHGVDQSEKDHLFQLHVFIYFEGELQKLSKKMQIHKSKVQINLSIEWVTQIKQVILVSPPQLADFCQSFFQSHFISGTCKNLKSFYFWYM